jgi:hypothetical protein
MDNEPPTIPLHEPDLTKALPPWLPPWILLCISCTLMGGLLGYFVVANSKDSFAETAFLIGSIIGFVFSMFSGWLMWLTGRETGLPNWLGNFLIVVVMIWFGYLAVKDRIVTTGGQYGQKTVIFEDPNAKFFGYLLIYFGGFISVWMILRVPRTNSLIVAGILGLMTMMSAIVWLQIRG